MASPAFGTSTTLAGGFKSGNVTINVPSSVAANDILVIVIYREDTSDSPTSTGFTSKSTVTESNHRLTILYKRATGADSGTYTVALSASGQWTEMACLRITGAITSGDPWDVVNTATSGANVTSAPNVAVTTTVADTLLVYAASNFTGGAWTPASGMSERTDLSGDMTTDTLAQAGTGGSGNKSASCAGSGRSCAFLGALKSPNANVSVNVESASLTFAADNPASSVQANVESASLTFVANNATTTTSTDLSVNVESASLTFAANGPAAAVAVAVGSASLTLAANAPVASARVNVESAALSFTANDTTTASGAIPPVGEPGVPWAMQVAKGGPQITDDDLDLADWEEITCIVEDPISITVGRQRPGEQAPARQMTFTLDNTDSRWSPDNAMSDLYPYVELGLVFRFWRRNSAGAFRLRATVALDDLHQGWPDGLEDDSVVTITASGPWRWLDQGTPVPVSATTSAATSQASALAVWPCTDGLAATAAASAVSGGAPANRTTSDVRFGQVPGPDGVLMYPDLRTSGRIHGVVPSTPVTNTWTITGKATVALISGSITCLYWQTTSTAAPYWRIRYDPGGPLTLRWIAPDGTETTVITYSSPIFDGSDVDSAWHSLRVVAEQSGSDVDVTLYVDETEVGSATVPSITTGRVTDLWGGDTDGPGSGLVSVGDLAVYSSSVVVTTTAAGDYAGEQAHVRWLRLVGELDIRGVCHGTESVQMGAQAEQSVVSALSECEDSEHGLQVDTADGSLQLITTREMYNQDPAVELDVDAQDLGLPFSALRSDAQAANDVTITRKGGSSRRKVVPARRTYKDSDTLSLYVDELATSAASWRANYGALTGARVPTLTWDAESSVDLLDATLALVCGQLLRAVNLPEQYAGGQADLILQGWTELHSVEVFSFTAFGSPADLYRVATVDPEGAPTQTAWRIDSDTSSLDTGIDADDTSIVVASGFGWSTTATPYDWDIGGEQVTVTAIGPYSSGVQTANVTRAVNGVAKSHEAGAVIRLWKPYRIGY